MIMQHTYELITPDRVSVFLVDRETQELVLEVSEDATGIRLPLTKGIAGHVTLTGQVALLAGAAAEAMLTLGVLGLCSTLTLRM